MNMANRNVREASKDLVVECLTAIGITPQRMDSYFDEGASGADVERRLTQFAGAILDQAKSDAAAISGIHCSP